MATNLVRCVEILSAEGVRHHLDEEQAVIRVAFVTRSYENLRGERLAIVRIETPDDGSRCRVAIERAFDVDGDPAAACLRFARFAADTPLVGFEFDAVVEDLRLVAEMPVEDGELTSLQLVSLIDRIVEAAECWHAAAGFEEAGRSHRDRPEAA